MKKVIKYLKFLMLGIFIFSCSEDFTDLPLLNTSDETAYYNSVESIDYTVTAAYATFNRRDIFDLFYTLLYGSIASDDAEAGGSGPSDWPEWHRIDWMTHTPNENNVLTPFFGFLYKGIYCCNLVLQYGEPMLASGELLPAEEDLLRTRLAETHFLRGYFHFILMQVYGGVPKLDRVIGSEEYSMGRNSIKEILEFVQSEMDLASADLPLKANVEDFGRASREAALAVKAKALLYESSYAKNYPDGGPNGWFTGCEQKWDQVLSTCREIIDPGYFSLVGIDPTDQFTSFWSDDTIGTGGYRYEFTVAGDNSSESVFEIQNNFSQASSGWTRTRGNYLPVYTVSRSFYENDSTILTTGPGWGFNCPNHTLLDEFEAGDPRIFTTFARTADDAGSGYVGDSISYMSTGDVAPRWYKFVATLSPTGMAGRKYEISPNEFNNHSLYNDWGDGQQNVRLIRYADVLLWAAEAIIEGGGDNSLALSYINEVRTRARNSGNTGVPADLTGTVDLDDLIHERRCELALEGHRFFDLVRWGIAEEMIEGAPLEFDGAPDVDFNPSRHLFFPISTNEIQISGGLSNPGW